MSHYLDSLMQPRAIAVVGASDRVDSAGGVIMRQLLAAGYQGMIYPINPKRPEVAGIAAYPSLDDLMADLANKPESQKPELAILAIANGAIEEALDSLIRHGIKAATIYSTLVVEEDGAVVAPALKLVERVKKRAKEGGIALCGGNCMAFYNYKHRVMAVPFMTRTDHKVGEAAGSLALITHSGSVFNSLLDSDARLDFNFAVSSGQELTTSAADYLDYALEQPEIVAVGMVLETVRDPQRFIAALEKAAKKRIAIIILKLGRTSHSAVLAQSHSGALVGNHGSYRALFAKYGVFEVETISDLGASLLLFQHCFGGGKKIPPGGLATIHDSGGERVLFVDLASDLGVPLAPLTETTIARLSKRLEPGMLPVNPLDAWGTGRDNTELFHGGFEDLALDDNVALAAIIGDRQAPGIVDAPFYLPLLNRVRAQTSKPIALVSNHRGVGSDDSLRLIMDQDYPVMDDVKQFLMAVKQVFDHRDRPQFESVAAVNAMKPVVAKWRPILDQRGGLGEVETLQLLRDIGIETTPSVVVTSLDELAAVADTMPYPLVMKTAMPDIAHKSEVKGVKLNLKDFAAVEAAWHDLSQRLGPRVLMTPMVDLAEGMEMIIGVSQDAQFGSILVFGLGGIYAEILKDTVTALPPLSPAMVEGQLKKLRGYSLLLGQRGRPAVAIDQLVAVIVKLGQFVAEYGAGFGDLDINPILVTPKKAIALDGFLNHCTRID
ncbi:MAG: acetate--CoA ligase family protein [Candidatus Pacebacteria bacterium]|nr:acetate--CoA ligase family protein [Candidatus Paceibacterota bacterium]